MVENQNDVKVSIIIPVYNTAPYLKQCIESILSQSLQDIELICIDDASTDNSLEIIKNYEEKDQRLHVISYKENKGTSQARKDGVLEATGEYIMFVDSDDCLTKDACENLYSVISQTGVDMVQFGTNIIDVAQNKKKRIDNLEKFLIPYISANGSTLKDSAVFEGCFVQKLFGYTIWNKIYKADLCKKAFNFVKDGYFPKSQDLYAFFILCYYARSYYGVNDKYYNYRFGSGITGKKNISLKALENYCHSVDVANAIVEFANTQDSNLCKDIAKQLRLKLLDDCVNNWYSYITPTESSAGFDLLTKYWGKNELVASLHRQHFNHKKELAEKIFGAHSIESKPKTIKTIGIFYRHYNIGGVQRVISLLIPIYHELGYNIVLFTDEISENEYVLPEYVKRAILPDSLTLKKGEYQLRADEFIKYIDKYSVDVMCYQSSSTPRLLFDMLLLKLHNIPVILTVHEEAFQGMLKCRTSLADRPDIFKLADCVTVLSHVEESYWRAFGINAVYCPNPIPFQLQHRSVSQIEKHSILWVGHLDTTIKRVTDTIGIMKEVVNVIPDAKLYIVGDEYIYEDGVYELLQKSIEKNNLTANIILCGSTQNIEDYYKKTQIHLVTSASEVFPMTIAESKAYGVPLVMYDLPWLEICKDGKGFLSAHQGDKAQAAQNIISIMLDETLETKLQHEAQESLEPFLEFDLKSYWGEIFDNLFQKHVSVPANGNTELILRSMLQQYEYGMKTNKQQKKALEKATTKLKEKSDRQKNRSTELKEKLNNQKVKDKKLKEKLENSKRKNEKLQAKLDAYKQENQTLKKKLKNAKKENHRIQNSTSYKIGRAITYIPRRIKKLFKK